jgi:PHD/YefM family antitoxin component YafN of YafNO toxin-antitoxin module
MKKLLTSVLLLTTLLTAKTVTINKGTAYEAKVTSKGESLYVTQQGKKQKVYTRVEELSDDEGNDLEF